MGYARVKRSPVERRRAALPLLPRMLALMILATLVLLPGIANADAGGEAGPVAACGDDHDDDSP